MPVTDTTQLPSILTRLDRYCPFLLRAMSKTKGRSTTLRELALRCSWCESKVKFIAHKDSWRTVPVEDVVLFSNACGLNLNLAWRAPQVLKDLLRRDFDHLSRRNMRLLVQKMGALRPDHPALVNWMTVLKRVNLERGL